MLPTSVMAISDDVAVNSNTEQTYTSLAEAISEAEDGEEIKLLKDINLNSYLTIDDNTEKNLTLNLNEYKIDTSLYVIIYNGIGTLRIINGTITSRYNTTDKGAITLDNGNLEIDSVTIKNQHGRGIFSKNSNSTKNATVTVSNSTIETYGHAIIVQNYIDLSITDSTITSTGASTIATNLGTLVITNSYIKYAGTYSLNAAIFSNQTVVTISGGEISAISGESSSSSNGFAINYYVAPDVEVPLTIQNNARIFCSGSNSTIMINNQDSEGQPYNADGYIKLDNAFVENTGSGRTIYTDINMKFCGGTMIINSTSTRSTIYIVSALCKVLEFSNAVIMSSSSGHNVLDQVNANTQIVISGPTAFINKQGVARTTTNLTYFSDAEITASVNNADDPVHEFEQAKLDQYKYLIFSKKGVTAITDTDLTDKFNAPVIGAIPPTTIESDQYSGTITWIGNPGKLGAPSKFDSNKYYTAKITLTAKEGYTFFNFPNNFRYSKASSISQSKGYVDVYNITIRFGKLLEPLTGSLSIDNINPRVGDTLSAVFENSNIPEDKYYTWEVDGEFVSDESTYTVTKEDIGKSIKLTVSSESLEGSLVAETNAVLKKINTQTPEKPELITVTTNSITLKSVTGYEYSMDGSTWSNSCEFTGFNPYTTYTFYQRIAETDDTYASEVSEALIVTTICEHEYTSTVTLESTTQSKGIRKFTCIFCGENYTEEIPMLPPSIIEGNNGIWNPDTPTTLTFTSNAAFEHFLRILINGQTLNEDCYEMSSVSASIRVTLKNEYLETLEPDTYTIDIESTGGIASTEFTVEPRHEHNWGEGVVTTEPTTTSKGVRTYTCSCGDTYTEEIPMLPPAIIEGENATWKPDDATPPTFRSNAAFSDFLRVLLNGEELDPEYYEISEGSIIVTLKEEFLKTLKPGKYTLGIESEGGVATTEFTIAATSTNPTTPSEPSDIPTPSKPINNETPVKPAPSSKNPQTSDSTFPIAAFLFIIAAGAITTIKIKKKA